MSQEIGAPKRPAHNRHQVRAWAACKIETLCVLTSTGY